MATPLRVLLVEDNEDDTRLLVRGLGWAGYDVRWERVETYESMATALDRGGWDAIIADFSLPSFSGPAALAVYRARALDIPFIVVSGSISEEQAVEAMRAGAHDFVAKSKLARLGPAMARELRDTENRRARRKAEEEQRAAEEKYRLLLQHMPALTYTARADRIGQMLFVSPQILEMTGFMPEEWVADRGLWLGQLHPDDRERVLVALRSLTGGGQPFLEEYRMVRRDGQVAWWRDHARLVRDPEGGPPLLHGFVQDVTERRRASEELRAQREALFQAEKLAVMGQLLASVAHELNNPLAVVIGQASLLGREGEDARRADRIEKLTKAAERCARIVKNFLALARQQPPQRQRVAINQVVEEAVELLAHSLRIDGIEVTLSLGRDLPPLRGDGHQLHQVLINLMTNAQHALRAAPGPRRITVTSRHDAAAGRVVVSVADTGPGMTPEVMARIFDPFFTTKPPGQGTGLGLPLCQGIVESHGGGITVESQPGAGAVFRIDLPVAAAAAEAVETSAATPPAPGPKSILVVDDEAPLAEILAELLRSEGHQVDTAGDGLAALEKMEQGTYDLVLADVRMPHLEGPALYEEAVRRRPSMKGRFIFITGDTLSPRTREFLESWSAPHLGKPFSLEEVRRVITRVLQGRP